MCLWWERCARSLHARKRSGRRSWLKEKLLEIMAVQSEFHMDLIFYIKFNHKNEQICSSRRDRTFFFAAPIFTVWFHLFRVRWLDESLWVAIVLYIHFLLRIEKRKACKKGTRCGWSTENEILNASHAIGTTGTWRLRPSLLFFLAIWWHLLMSFVDYFFSATQQNVGGNAHTMCEPKKFWKFSKLLRQKKKRAREKNCENRQRQPKQVNG